jgi:oligoendopeptidase F
MILARSRLAKSVVLLVVLSSCGSPPSARPTTAPPAPATTPTSTPVAAASAPAGPDANIARDQIPARYRWDIAPLFANDAAFEAAMTATEQQRTQLGACRGTLGDPARLRACLDLYLATRLATNRMTLYAALQQSTDSESPAIQGKVDRAQSAMRALIGVASTMRGEILALSDDALARAYRREAGLAPLRPYIEQMRRRRAHVLGAEAENVLSLMGDNQFAEIDLNELPSAHERAFQALIDQVELPTITDEHGESVALTLASYGKYRSSADRRVRRDTVEGLFGVLRDYDRSFTALLGGQAQFTVSLARSRGYSTALDAYLDRDEVAPAVYRNLVTAVEANLAPLHRYARLRKQQMQLDELHVYDLYPPLVPPVQSQVPYEAGVAIVEQALAPLGPEYAATLTEGMAPASGWVDVYPHAGKESGAFAANIYGTHPFVLINYFEELDDVLTLAHEFGHAMHAHYSNRAQPYVTASAVSMVAETASTFNEVMVMRQLIANARNDDEKLFLLGQLVESIRTTVYRQSLFASFELSVHTAVEAGTPITAELLRETYAGLVRRYYGDALTLGPNDGMEWAYVPHFYYKFYVYSYAMGLCSGIALSERVRAGSPEARDAYLGMLSAGSSRPPLDLLRSAGVDPSQPEVVAAAARLLDESLGQMEEILARRAAAPAVSAPAATR